MRKPVLFLIILAVCAALACQSSLVSRPEPLDFPTLPFSTEATLAAQQTAAPNPPGVPLPTSTVLSPESGSPPATPTRQPTQPLPALTPPAGYLVYAAQSGDTLPVVAKHFGVFSEEITSPQPLPPDGLIPTGQALVIPDVVDDAPYNLPLLPDSEVVDSATAIGFDVAGFVRQAGGYLSSYSEAVGSETLDGAQIVQRVSDNTSVNPRLILAFLEFRSQWVYSKSPAGLDLQYPLDFRISGSEGLFPQLSIAAKLINLGFYTWLDGSLTELDFPDGDWARPAPRLNAGSMALQYLFARLFTRDTWYAFLYGDNDFPQLYSRMFGDPWQRAARVEPLFPPGLQPPVLELPFAKGEEWRLTSGPHPDWNTGTPAGALDFAPSPQGDKCEVSPKWVRASAPGLVVRSRDGEVLVDLDQDGYEQTGWVSLYLHIATQDRVPVGTVLKLDDPIGHPSCEGGEATGSHVHIARMYNGEWIGAGPALPLVLSGWTAVAGENLYEGTLVKGDQVVTAFPNVTLHNTIVR